MDFWTLLVWERRAFRRRTIEIQRTQGTLEASRVLLGMGLLCGALLGRPGSSRAFCRRHAPSHFPPSLAAKVREEIPKVFRASWCL